MDDDMEEVRGEGALSRDRSIAHSFPCQKGRDRAKSRAGPPTIPGSSSHTLPLFFLH